MRIDPNYLPEFRDWMRAKLATTPTPTLADLTELRGLITMMKAAQWAILDDVADRAESDVVGTLDLNEDDMLELDEDESIYYKQFLNERYGSLTKR